MYVFLYLLGALLSVLMANKPKRRRRMGCYIRGNIDETVDLGTLAAKTAILASLSVVNERTLISSIVAYWSLADFTNAIGDGPIMVGVAHSDYTLAEVEEYLEATGLWTEGDMKAKEVSSRKIRRIGLFQSSVADSFGIAVLNDGKPIKTKLNWILNQGQSIKVWAYNAGDSALATTDPDLVMNGHANLFPT